MATTADYQAELRSVLVGAGTDYPLVGQIDGLIGFPVTAADAQPAAYHGTTRQGDRARGRVLSLPVGVDKSTAADTADGVQTLVDAWRPATEDLALEVRIPGTDWTRTFYGRPRLREAAGDLADLRASWAQMDLEFHCSSPYGYGAQVTDASNTGTFTVSPGGSAGAETRRAALLFVGNGGTPSLVHNGTGGRIDLGTVPGAGAVAVVQLFDGFVGVGPLGSPVADPDLLLPTSTWLALNCGESNSLTVSGCSSVTIVYEPAWW